MKEKLGMSKHTNPIMKNDEWLTPPEIIKSLGEFDLDPCSPIKRPWDTARKHYTIEDNGLVSPWEGRVWCNPPYGLEAKEWLEKLSNHGNGIALIFARTETEMFFSQVWDKASGILFIKGRLFFHYVDGSKAKSNSGAPSCLIAYGRNNANILSRCNIPGKYIDL